MRFYRIENGNVIKKNKVLVIIYCIKASSVNNLDPLIFGLVASWGNLIQIDNLRGAVVRQARIPLDSQ